MNYLFKNFVKPLNQQSYNNLNVLQPILKRGLYPQKKLNILYEGMINQISKFILRSIDNDTYYFKGILKEKDKSEFIKSIEKEMHVH